MAIKYIIEGAKGTGKSTLCEALANDGGYEIEHFSGDRTAHESFITYFNNALSTHQVIDRFYLSYTIYGFVQDAYQHFDIQQSSTDLVLKTWSPLSVKDFIKMIDETQHNLIILYSSDHHLLENRLMSRSINEGKSYSKDEFEALRLSNVMFKAYASILKEAYSLEHPDQRQKVISIDVSKVQSTEELLEIIYSS